MSVIQNNLLLSGDDAYNLQRSLRFRSSASAYLSRTPSSAGNRKTWTYSCWLKRGVLSTDQSIFSAGEGTVPWFGLFLVSSNKLEATFTAGSAGGTVTTQVFRDPSAWYHIVVAVDTTQATASNRLKMYVNGVQITTFDSTNYPSQNTDTQVNNTIVHKLGSNNYAFDGYLTEQNFIDGQALTPSSFGENNAQTGVWQPKRYTGTYGTNGFYLPFTNNSTTTTLGNDFSGNGNNWTTNNISLTAGATYDSMTDVPTLTSATQANFCTLNPTIRPYPSADNILNANLRVTNTVGSNISGSAWGTIPVTSGKWYAECTVTTVGNWSGSSDYIGISNNAITAGLGTYNGPLRDAGYTYVSNGQKAVNGSGSAYGASYTTGDVIGIALDADSNSITFYKNGTSQGVAFTSMTNTGGYLFGSTLSNNGVHDWNFGQRPFAYTPPTGFVALNTFNLPTPTIGATASTQANKYFDISLYSGNNSTQTVTNSGSMQPDMVWIKSRNVGGSNHVVTDSVRGVNRFVIPNLTDSEYNIANTLTSFNSNGFSLGNTAYDFNISGNNYVGWQWRAANGNNVTNTAGSITSTVSANTSSGFSIVTYTGTGANATVGHGLGVAPRMVITKVRSTTNPWYSYHASLGAGQRIQLNETSAAVASGLWQSTAPTSSVFSISSDVEINGSGRTYVAYCFAEVAGFSRFGSYTGNGSSDGPFVFTNFQPKYVLIKRTDSAEDWIVMDSARNTFNVANSSLFPNGSFSETTDSNRQEDFLSNGFKIRSSGVWLNANGGTYIYAAFAENPFKYSLAR